MMWLRILLGICFTIATLGLGNWAHAAGSESPKRSVTNVDSIRRFMEKGQSLFVAGQFQRAAEIFEAGYELHPYSAFLFNAGVALEKSGKLTEAIEHFKKYLEVDPKAPDAPEVAKRIERVEQQLKDLASQKKTDPKAPGTPDGTAGDGENSTKSLVIVETEPSGAPLRILRRIRGESSFEVSGENPDWLEVMATESPANVSLDVGQYHVKVERFRDYNQGDTSFEVLAGHVLQVKVNLSQGEFMGHLRVTSNVPNARVYLDVTPEQGQPAGKTPFSDFVTVGKHTVLVTATGYEPVTKVLAFDRGQQQEVKVDLQRVAFGGLRISSNVAGAAVLLDGLPVGTSGKPNQPLELQKLRAGKHRLRVTAEGRKPLEAEVDVPRGQYLPAHARLVVLPPRGAAYTQAIIGGVLLGGGIYFGLESNRLYDELRADHGRGTLASDDPRELRGKIYSIGADIAFLGAAAIGGLSIYNFVRDPLPPSRLVTYKPVEFDTPNRTPASTTKDSSDPSASSRSPSSEGNRGHAALRTTHWGQP